MFLRQYQRQRKCFLSERELKKALRDTLTRAAWLGPVIFDWFVLSMRMQVILDSSFARPGSAPIWSWKKGEFRDWTTALYNKSLSFSGLYGVNSIVGTLVDIHNGLAEFNCDIFSSVYSKNVYVKNDFGYSYCWFSVSRHSK